MTDTNETQVEVTQCCGEITWHEKTWAERYARYGETGRAKRQKRRVPNPPPANKLVRIADTPVITGPDVDRFFALVAKGDCWEWTGPANGNVSHKYGSFSVKGRSYRAHRISYAFEHGGIPSGKVLDHLCRNTLCVNPDHLEPVTSGENTRRGDSCPTHCKRGHELSGENVRMVGAQRKCRKCARIRTQKWRAKKNG